MAKVEFCNENITVQVDEGATILEAARQAGVTVESPCNGAGVCGKCRVRVDGRSVENILHGNSHRLSREEELEGYVLACEARIKGDIAVKTSESHKHRYLKILDHGKSFDILLDAFIRKRYDAAQGLTHVYAGEELLGSEDGDTASESFGAVVDIGTTTLVASLVDLNSGEELDSISALNPQALHAQDVLSRIKLASEESGLKLMYSGLIAEINRMMADLTKRNNTSRERIYEVVFSGNTCMLHLASNTNPYSLGRFPYHSEITGDVHLKAGEHNPGISKFGIIYLPPVISALQLRINF
ncbi:MAG: 2Fe-2S iron-sulfur cluster-binding protein [Clostridiales bacterium]|nr:2Fe-2S iron-sulfur cluster-binding protein [Eubacteriales bacterium]MDH7567415.1 2Fe-2S iron-sulfur cluster-binding protein [Clostridiales bacterium]